jgi:subtilase family serine protease
VAVEASFPMEHMILLLQPDRAQQAALDELVDQQQDPKSSQFHKFLSPEQFAARFGASQNDIAKISGWLAQHGFSIEEVTANHLSIVFSGDAYAVESAFRTEVKEDRVNGELHHANASDPQIPTALAGVVRGVVKLHDFHARSFTRGLRPVDQTSSPLYTASSTTHYLAPADFAQI